MQPVQCTHNQVGAPAGEVLAIQQRVLLRTGGIHHNQLLFVAWRLPRQLLKQGSCGRQAAGVKLRGQRSSRPKACCDKHPAVCLMHGLWTNLTATGTAAQ